MNVKNYQFLTESLNALGFSDKLNDALKTKMNLDMDSFELKASGVFGKDQMTYAVKVEKGKAREDGGEQFYFMNGVKATMIKEDAQIQSHDFRLFNQRGFNAKEMYNLLDERPVHKTFKNTQGELVGSWTRIDFSSLDENGNGQERRYFDEQTNFQLAKEVGKLNLVFANREEKEGLLKDLRSGDLVEVSIKRDGRMEKAYVGVPLQISGVRLYDANMKEIKRTDGNNLQVIEEKPTKANTAEKTNDRGEGKDLPDSTKKLVEKSEKNQQQGQAQEPGGSKRRVA
jgi:hypothetical protein